MKLLNVLFPKARAETLRILFAEAGRELHLRELARQSGLVVGTMQGELKSLMAADLLKSRRDGNRLYYRANDEHPLFMPLQELVLKTAGLREILAEALSGLPGIEIAFVFGSLAESSGTGGSDVDLMVIGKASLRSLASRLKKATIQLGREINTVTMTATEFTEKRGSSSFLKNVLESKKLFVKGGEHELGRLG